MHFVNPIPFVADIARSRAFYADIMQLTLVADHGDFVQFAGGFAIHDGSSLERTVWGAPAEAPGPYGRRNLVLYFEHDDIDRAFDTIGPHVTLIHPVERQHWGQRVFRFHDPDGHVIEIGEPTFENQPAQPN